MLPSKHPFIVKFLYATGIPYRDNWNRELQRWQFSFCTVLKCTAIRSISYFPFLWFDPTSAWIIYMGKQGVMPGEKNKETNKMSWINISKTQATYRQRLTSALSSKLFELLSPERNCQNKVALRPCAILPSGDVDVAVSQLLFQQTFESPLCNVYPLGEVHWIILRRISRAAFFSKFISDGFVIYHGCGHRYEKTTNYGG